MIKEIEINNYKSFANFKCRLAPLTIIAGDNGAGKSSFLQVLAFLKYACTSSAVSYLKDRELEVGDILSAVTPKLTKIVSMGVSFDFGSGEGLRWDVTFATERTKNRIALRSERVTGMTSGTVYLRYDPDRQFRLSVRTGDEVPLAEGEYDSSLIKFIGPQMEPDYPQLHAIKSYFENMEVLDLLDPQQMRGSSRGHERTLGVSGKNLPSFIKSLSAQEKSALLEGLHAVAPNLSDVEGVVSQRAGWTRLQTRERFGEEGEPIKVAANDISDGTLRLIALFAIRALKREGGAVLLDEVEDGINARNLETVYKLMRTYGQKNRQQVIMTTHSSVLLDYAEPEDVLCLYRDGAGRTLACGMSDSTLMREKLEYLYPGEALLSLEKGEWPRAFGGGQG